MACEECSPDSAGLADQFDEVFAFLAKHGIGNDLELFGGGERAQGADHVGCGCVHWLCSFLL